MSFNAFGHEWIVDASGCDPVALRSPSTLASMFSEIILAMGVTTVGQPVWHVFADEAGVTGLQMLSESHLACHTYPEAGYAAFSLYCCRRAPSEWAWEARLGTLLGATSVTVRVVRRGPSGAA